MPKKIIIFLFLSFFCLRLPAIHAQAPPPAVYPPAAQPLTPVVHSHYSILRRCRVRQSPLGAQR